MQRFEKEVSIIDGVTIGNSSDQWLRHYSSNDKRNRVEPLIRHLAFLGVDEIGFKEIIQTLRERHVVELDSLSVSVALEAARQADMKLPSFTYPNAKQLCENIDCKSPPFLPAPRGL